ncbi:insulin-like peptide receptor isoform X2 [Episyrphus balteatus]|uniref:insulin-like peptide receptor isoform X2 n=1 Tax=Episyrphus balteatus TaxID=286459 RepID=UPI002485AB8E|nr:insulin-like peptide receptor isoform X2 [Episyrphus balteatus]
MARLAVFSLIVLALVVLIIQDLPILISARECTDVDIRNSVASFSLLEDCSVIKGFLLIVLIKQNLRQTNYSNLTFPKLREITDFFLMYEVNGITDMKNMFPNLVVIRGRRLFQSYALAISNVPELKIIEFPSLIAIQRGHVYIGNCPKLCFLKKINWERMTLTSGENHIFPAEQSSCDLADCLGCDYCWSYRACQKFENSNLFNLARGNTQCSQHCLGGCWNDTLIGCNVCKGITDHGECVGECPPDMYYSENHQRCYTKEECYSLRFYILGRECNRQCPSGYNRSRRLGECVKCESECVRDCHPDEGYQEYTILSLSDAEGIKGCQHLKGSLVIQIGAKVEEDDLAESLKSLQIVDGYIKVYYSPFLRSLNFLQNLEKIGGKPLENDTFALVLYNNQNLQELWNPQPEKIVEFVNGGIYSYANNKLCNKIVQDFDGKIIHNKERDLIQINDQDVLCEPVRLYVNEKRATQNSVQISWLKEKTADEVEVIYRESQYFKGEESELDDDVCMRVHWQRDLMFKTDVEPENSTHLTYFISNLTSYTFYDYFVKTFEKKDSYSARSHVQRFLTKPDFPTPPQLITYDKKFDNITFMFIPRNKSREVVKYYILESYELTNDLETLDTRDYCLSPVIHYAESGLEDFDDCCQRKREKLEDDEFKSDMEAKFVCSMSSKPNCHPMIKNAFGTTITLIDAKADKFTLASLRHFTRYTSFLYACNDMGCGTYFMHTERTSFAKGHKTS